MSSERTGRRIFPDWPRRLLRLLLLVPLALGLPGVPALLWAQFVPGIGRPDGLEFPVHRECGSRFARRAGTLVTCSYSWSRIQVYSVRDGFADGLFAPATASFSVWVSPEGQVRMHEAGRWRPLPLWVEPRTEPAGPEGEAERPLTWEEVRLRETSRRIEVREQGTGALLAEIEKRSLLARSPERFSTFFLTFGSALAILALRPRSPAVSPTA